MKTTIVVPFAFEAAHHLPTVPLGHKCGGNHGHSWRIEVHVSGPVDQRSGWVIDYADVEAACLPVRDLLDHKDLNEIPGLELPTAENLARWIWRRLEPLVPGLSKLVISEGFQSYRCEYEL